MARVSILIPARNEGTTLARTIQDVYEKARGEFEVLVGLDGMPFPDVSEYPNLRVIKYFNARGTKPLLNDLAYQATGKYLFKLDAHCALSEGFDVILQDKMQDNWVVSPRLYVLNPETWAWQDERHYDYFYLPCPLTDPRLYRFQAGGHWVERTKQRRDPAIDENMKLHGSSFFINRDFFLNQIKGFDLTHIDSASGEDIELSLKTWLGPWDGRLMVNKKVWVAHMHKGKNQPKSFYRSQSSINASYLYTANYWMSNQWKERAHDLRWLIERFWPIPGWPDDWEERQRIHEQSLELSGHKVSA